MKYVTSEIAFDIEEEADIIAKLLVWPQGAEYVKYNVKWRKTDHIAQTSTTPEELAEIEIEDCQLASVDDCPITENQAMYVDLIVDRMYDDNDLEAKIWEISDEHDEYVAQYQAEADYEARNF